MKSESITFMDDNLGSISDGELFGARKLYGGKGLLGSKKSFEIGQLFWREMGEG